MHRRERTEARNNNRSIEQWTRRTKINKNYLRRMGKVRRGMGWKRPLERKTPKNEREKRSNRRTRGWKGMNREGKERERRKEHDAHRWMHVSRVSSGRRRFKLCRQQNGNEGCRMENGRRYKIERGSSSAEYNGRRARRTHLRGE